MKNRGTKIIILAIVILLFGATFACAKARNEAATEKESAGFLSNLRELKDVSDIMDIILENYVGEKIPTKKELLHGAIKGMVDSLDDPHSVYFSAEQMKSFEEDIKGEYAGVGMVVSKQDKVLTVVSPIEDTPAYQAGMRPKDKIIAIEEESTYDLSISECVDRLKGKPNTIVKITVFREGAEKAFDVELKRAIIKLNYVKYKMYDDGIGYLRLTQFGDEVSVELRKAFEDLQSQGLKALVFDLRNNPGGALSEAVKVSSLFVDKSPIVTIRDLGGNETVHNPIGLSYTDFPLIVLINEGSASASEIVAGAVKDHKRGLLIGEKSFGKGSVQNLIPLSDNDGLKLTIAKYYTPSGVCIHNKGIEPDITVKEEDDYMFFNSYITNISEEESKENKKELIEEIKGKEEAERLSKKEDAQLKTALNTLKALLLYKQ